MWLNSILVTCLQNQNQSKPGCEHRHIINTYGFDTQPTRIGLSGSSHFILPTFYTFLLKLAFCFYQIKVEDCIPTIRIVFIANFFSLQKLPLMIQRWNSGIVLKLKFESLELFYMIIQEVGKSAREVWVKTLRNWKGEGMLVGR